MRIEIPISAAKVGAGTITAVATNNNNNKPITEQLAVSPARLFLTDDTSLSLQAGALSALDACGLRSEFIFPSLGDSVFVSRAARHHEAEAANQR
jgi:hypothetical protein